MKKTENYQDSSLLGPNIDFNENHPFEQGFRRFFQENIVKDLKNLQEAQELQQDIVYKRLKTFVPLFIISLLIFFTNPSFIEAPYNYINQTYYDWYSSLTSFFQFILPRKILLWNFGPFTTLLVFLSSLGLIWSLSPAIRFSEMNPQNYFLYQIARFVFSKDTKLTTEYDLSGLYQSGLVPAFDHAEIENTIQTSIKDKILNIEIVELKNDRLTKNLSLFKYNYVFNGLIFALQYKDTDENEYTGAVFANSPAHFSAYGFLTNRYSNYERLSAAQLPANAKKWLALSLDQNLADLLLTNPKCIDIFNKLTNSIDLNSVGIYKKLASTQVYDKVLLEITDNTIYVMLPLKSNIYNFWSFFRKPDYEKDLHHMLLEMSLMKELLTSIVP